MEFKSRGNFGFYADTQVNHSLTYFPFPLCLNTSYWWEWNPWEGREESGIMEVSALMMQRLLEKPPSCWSWANLTASAGAKHRQWTSPLPPEVSKAGKICHKNGPRDKKEWMFIKARDEEKNKRKMENEGQQRENGGRRNHTALQEQLCDSSSNVTLFCLSWKDPINASAPSNSRPSSWMAPIRAQGKSND